MLRGQDAQLRAWREAVAGGRLHHAWLLSGPRGLGKASFARRAAQVLLGAETGLDARLVEVDAHPDLITVEREVWDKASPPRVVPRDQRKEGDARARSIRIGQIRALESVLGLAPSRGPARAIIIDAADDLERNGANALLKMLEEPPAGTVFLLVNHVPGRLLATVRSRCRLLRFPPLGDAEVDAVLRERMPELAAGERVALVAAAQGSPGQALRLGDAGLGELDALLHELVDSGDPTNATRNALVKLLAGKAQTERYLAFLERAPSFIAAQALDPVRRGRALDAWSVAQQIAAEAVAQSLPPDAVVFELAGRVAALAGDW